MLRPIIYFASCLFVFSCLHAARPELRICKFQDNKAAALSLTFDDGLLDHNTIVQPMLKEAGILATFYIVTSWTDHAGENRDDPSRLQFMSWEQVRGLAEDGHEIGNHSYSHRNVRDATEAQKIQEVVEPIALLEEKTGQRPVTFCFPGNALDDATLEFVQKHHINARTLQFPMGRNLKLSSFEGWIRSLLDRERSGVAMIHGIIPRDNPYSALPNGIEDFREVLNILNDVREDLWIDTFAKVSKYEQLRDSASVVWSEDGASFTIETDLDTEVYDIPLTIEILQDGKSRLMQVVPNEPIANVDCLIL